jgi:hypothetical protein
MTLTKLTEGLERALEEALDRHEIAEGWAVDAEFYEDETGTALVDAWREVGHRQAVAEGIKDRLERFRRLSRPSSYKGVGL